MKPFRSLIGSPFRRVAVLLALSVLVPACGGGGGGPIVLPNPGAIGFAQAVFTGGESSGTVTITVSRSGGSLGAVSVNYATSNGTAGAGDYTSTNGTLSWADGDAANKTFTVTLTPDVLVEGDETVNLSLSLPTGGSVLGLSSAVLVITDDDAGGTSGVIQFSSATYSVNEGAGTATITATRTGPSTGAVAVTYATTPGTATAGSDYTTTTNTLNWTNGDSAPKTFTVAIIDDATPAEGNETVNLTLSAPTNGAVLGSISTAVLTIVDNDSAGSLQFTSATYSVSESGGSATITVSRTGGTGGVVSVNYTTTVAGSTATAGTDYTGGERHPDLGRRRFVRQDLCRSDHRRHRRWSPTRRSTSRCRAWSGRRWALRTPRS
jgi:hypothetical protein